MQKPRNIAHVMHHLECIDPTLKPKFQRIADRMRYQAPELVGHTWKVVADILQHHPASEAQHKAMHAVFGGRAMLHVDHVKLHLRGSGPCSEDEIAAYLHDQCVGITADNRRDAALYCIGVGVQEGWLTRTDRDYEYNFSHHEF